ncbi:membrane protein insertion efficiency factor YidD [Commensalibacter melissae]|uniref:membrane protein insertion efficiency factor YidD n=1 Tax=Commensalibacter melissae TaxID=2070537 RepID=UPI0012D94EF5|nr:membrane protein insertion efficiency factor YidD [Commensalibacter melissae]MUH04700.1 membrane protein insertion efficiency factor YidD [Commensalibacter melissae]
MKKLLIHSIDFYRLCISPFLGHNCRFNPSCSEYMKIAIEQHGVVKGILSGGWRILRCNPWNAGGNDPVPPKKTSY